MSESFSYDSVEGPVLSGTEDGMRPIQLMVTCHLGEGLWREFAVQVASENDGGENFWHDGDKNHLPLFAHLLPEGIVKAPMNKKIEFNGLFIGAMWKWFEGPTNGASQK